MNVAVLYSGGKDSTFAIQRAMQKGWSIKYLISIKPTRKDCYLFHYATVEHTKELAKILNLPQVYVECTSANPIKEASIIKNIVEKNQKSMHIDAVVLGGVGLQKTQLKSIQDALLPLRVEAFASHAGEEHGVVMEQMLDNGYDMIITQVASDGLNKWLGKRLSKENFAEFKNDATKFGFHIGGEGGYYDTLVVDAPIFTKKMDIGGIKTVMEDNFCGHVEIGKWKIIEKYS